MVNYFVYNGESSLDYGIYVGGQDTFNAPQRDVTKVAIPGRNGDLIKDNGRWLNTPVQYNIVIMDEFKAKADEVRAWLCKPKGYARLEDTYNPEYYRMARVGSTINFSTAAWNEAGRATILFDCKPQRFLKSGEGFVEVENGGFIYNPTRFESKPKIRIECSGSGILAVGNYNLINVSGISTYVDIDSELMDCYAGVQSMNNKVSLVGGFPVLAGGATPIAWTGDITRVRIAGRWFTV